MIRMFFAFFVVFMIFWFVVPKVYQMKTNEKIQLTKLVLYSIICSLAAVATLTLIVILF